MLYSTNITSPPLYHSPLNLCSRQTSLWYSSISTTLSCTMFGRSSHHCRPRRRALAKRLHSQLNNTATRHECAQQSGVQLEPLPQKIICCVRYSMCHLSTTSSAHTKRLNETPYFTHACCAHRIARKILILLPAHISYKERTRHTPNG